MYINQILYFFRLFKNIRYRLEDMGQFPGSSKEDDNDDDDDDEDHDHDDDMKMTKTTTLSRRRKPKPSRHLGRAGRGEGAQPEGGARRCPLRLWTRTAARAAPRPTTTLATTAWEAAAAAERTISTRTQEEEEEEEEGDIIGQSFFSTPASFPSSASTDLKLDKHTACMW